MRAGGRCRCRPRNCSRPAFLSICAASGWQDRPDRDLTSAEPDLINVNVINIYRGDSDELCGTQRRMGTSRLRAAADVVLAPRLDRAHDPRLHLLVAARPRGPRLYDLEQKNGMLGRTRLRPLA